MACTVIPVYCSVLKLSIKVTLSREHSQCSPNLILVFVFPIHKMKEMLQTLIINYIDLNLPSCCSLETRWPRPAVRRCALPNRTCGPMTSASWARSHGTLNCRTLTATESRSILGPVLANPSPRTTRDLLPRNQSSPLLPRESTYTPEHSSLSPSSSSM